MPARNEIPADIFYFNNVYTFLAEHNSPFKKNKEIKMKFRERNKQKIQTARRKSRLLTK